MALETRPYGQTGDRVTVIGQGGVFLDQHSFDVGVATVHRALELGVTYFDTSPYYGSGMSQGIMGKALEGRSEKYMLATKIGRMRVPARSRSYDALRAQLDEGLRLLRRDSVDTVQVHESDQHVWWTDSPPPPERRDPLDPNYDFAGAPVMEVLRDIKEEGLCRFVGVTGNSADGVGLVASKVDADVCLIAFNYDILRRRARRETIPVARAKNMTVALGAIIRLPADMPDALERLYAVQRESGLSLVELTIRYLLADPDFSTILVGAAKPSEIEECVAAAETGPLPADLHQTLEALGVT
jgi:aryl-alcohol dehydrogenase-like predicted oxidoreductase